MLWIIGIVVLIIIIVNVVKQHRIEEEKRIAREREEQYRELEREVLKTLGFRNWNSIISEIDETLTVKSRQALEKYDDIKFFKENRGKLEEVQEIIKRKAEAAAMLRKFVRENDYKSHLQYYRLVEQIDIVLKNDGAYRIRVNYISNAGNYLGTKDISVRQCDIDKFKDDPTLLMSKGEYNKLLREQEKEALSQKQRTYYNSVNDIIKYANANRDALIIKGSQERLDDLVGQLFDRTVNSIKRIKSYESEEWDVIKHIKAHIKDEIEKIVHINRQILKYYDSPDFLKIKETCEALMSSQREFNEYINEKVQSISRLFGTRVVRNETIHNDEFNYLRPYKKTITPFVAEVSAQVFASAENSPLDYIVKYFYPNKEVYEKQIENLYRLVEELQTLREAKQIIENYKAEYQQYLNDVPTFIMENDEAGFYSRLGFAIIDENVLTVEYKFSYTSDGGLAQRFFTVPMTEETIAELIKLLESKLTATAFAKEQRTLMTKKLREFIKSRDNFTCCNCGNSTYNEPNLLLEIDHIIPIAKGGRTTEDNLQTLCWKCNRAKSDKIVME